MDWRLILGNTAMNRDVRPDPAIDGGVLGSIAVFGDGITSILGYLWTPEGKFWREFTGKRGKRSFAK